MARWPNGYKFCASNTIGCANSGMDEAASSSAAAMVPPGNFAFPAQLCMYTWASIGLAATFVNVADPGKQSVVFHLPTASRTPLPGIEAGAAHSIEPAHQPDRLLFFAVLDEGEDIAFRAEVKAMAFFKRSCSTFRRS